MSLIDKYSSANNGLVETPAVAGSLFDVLLTRRAVLKSTLLTAPVLLSIPNLSEARARSRELELYNTHTRERLITRFDASGSCSAGELDQLKVLLRDHRTGEMHDIDPALFDYLRDVAAALGVAPRFDVISGYRSPATNALLREHSSGVAKGSLHMQGKAIDVRLRSASCDSLARVALNLERGGVGLYRASDFVHLDTGHVRSWRG